MNRIELFETLNTMPLDKSKVIIISGASLVAQDIIENTKDIDLVTTLNYYNQINWKTKIGAFGVPVKYFKNFEISYNLYNESKDYIEINGFKFSHLDSILNIKLMLNRDKDKDIIEKLKKILKK